MMFDPVTAIAESEATGETASIFADIRATMQLPLITSIWRSLAADVDNLRAVWGATKPLYESGQPDAALVMLRETATLPIPDPLVTGQLTCAGISSNDLTIIRGLVDVYNRSNGMNLLALTALVVTPAGAPADRPSAPSPSPWPALPPLLTQADMSPDTWALLEHVNRFGAVPEEPGLATLWRHLAYWPGLLALIHAGFAPLQREGTIQRATGQILDIARVEGGRLAHLRSEDLSLPDSAREMIANYVLNPGLVARIASIGHGLAVWLRS